MLGHLTRSRFKLRLAATLFLGPKCNLSHPASFLDYVCGAYWSSSRAQLIPPRPCEMLVCNERVQMLSNKGFTCVPRATQAMPFAWLISPPSCCCAVTKLLTPSDAWCRLAALTECLQVLSQMSTSLYSEFQEPSLPHTADATWDGYAVRAWQSRGRHLMGCLWYCDFMILIRK